MDKKRSYVTFKDGHEEDIFYYKEIRDNQYIFATESGIYFYREPINVPGVLGVERIPGFTLYADCRDNPNVLPDICLTHDPSIKTIKIDKRVELKFTVPDYGDGTVLVEPNASTEEVACAIMSEMGVVVEGIEDGEA